MAEAVEGSPFEDLLAFFGSQGAAEWLWTYMATCAKHGVLHSDEEKCILARPVDSALDIEDLNTLRDLDPEWLANKGLTCAPDAWHIIYASGGIHGFFPLAPYELPKLIWQRDGEGPARIYDYGTIKRKVHGK